MVNERPPAQRIRTDGMDIGDEERSGEGRRMERGSGGDKRRQERTDRTKEIITLAGTWCPQMKLSQTSHRHTRGHPGTKRHTDFTHACQ